MRLNTNKILLHFFLGTSLYSFCYKSEEVSDIVRSLKCLIQADRVQSRVSDWFKDDWESRVHAGTDVSLYPGLRAFHRYPIVLDIFYSRFPFKYSIHRVGRIDRVHSVVGFMRYRDYLSGDYKVKPVAFEISTSQGEINHRVATTSPEDPTIANRVQALSYSIPEYEKFLGSIKRNNRLNPSKLYSDGSYVAYNNSQQGIVVAMTNSDISAVIFLEPQKN